MLCGMWDLSSPARDQDPCILEWKPGVLTTRQPWESLGNAVLSELKVILLSLCLSSSAHSWKWWVAETKMTEEEISSNGDLAKPWTWKMKG